jgi:hypothetical protein
MEARYPALAVDRRGQRFSPHPEATHFAVERCTVSSSYMMRQGTRPLTLPLDASIEDACQAVRDQPGLYRLPQCDGRGCYLDAPAAYFEIQAYGSAGRGHEVNTRTAIDLSMRMLEAEERMSDLLAQCIRLMLESQVQLQDGFVTTFRVANRTIALANGVKSLERQQTIDVPQLVKQLLAAMKEREPAAPMPPHWAELLASPLGARLMDILLRVLPAIVSRISEHKG